MGSLRRDVLAANMKIYKQFVNNARALQSKVRGADLLQARDGSDPGWGRTAIDRRTNEIFNENVG